MNRRKAEQWLSMAMDGELPERQRPKLQRCLEEDPSLQDLQESWRTLGAYARDQEMPAGKPAEVVWSDVQRTLRKEGPARSSTSPSSFGARRWALVGASLAICLVVLFATRYAFQPGEVEMTQVEWVETGIPDATTMVYQDPESGWTVVWVLDEGQDEDHVDS